MIESAKVTFRFAVGGCRNKNRPQTLQKKMKKKNVPAIGRYFMPSCGMFSLMTPRRKSTKTSTMFWSGPGVSFR